MVDHILYESWLATSGLKNLCLLKFYVDDFYISEHRVPVITETEVLLGT